ncbi:PREDICTED: kinesin-like protein KLP2 isoform X2 [Prunus mume]|uniref:Kinesin-like protein n=1 Tax=Prunus mume TaxID=102107 RepID=A0ABM0P6V9_PRUMU|nr:PREDICTED: kinesin-like protein KLP2 isoform X2 [Prunus mume]
MDPATEETSDMAKSENLGLFLRIRPLLQSGVRGDRNPRFRRKSAFEPWFQKMCLRVKTSRSVTLSPPLALERGRTKTEVYDGFSQVFSPDSSQEEVYEKMMRPLVEDFLRGKSGMLAAFGPSGSGKTHTIFGCNSQSGMVPLALQQIFKETSDSTRSLFISIFEIRCEGGKEERVFDLSPNGVDLTMHRSTLKGLHEVVISDWRHGEFVISQALLRRATSPTNANSQSSRSQCVINLRIVDDKSNGEVNDQANDGVLIIVDLAGAEREKGTGNQGVRLLESNFINKTSMVFCLCLRSLLEHQKNPMKPLEKHFQDSLLTKYLRDYMEGKKRMALILTVKAGGEDYHNTSCLLKQATPYMEIKFNNEPSKRRLSPSFVLKGYKEKLEVAEHEIQHLRESNLELEKELKDHKSQIEVAQEIQRLRESNLELETELKYLKSLIEVERLADDQVAEETQRLKESNLEPEKEVKDLKSLIDVQISGDDQWDDSVVEDLPNKNAISPSNEDNDRLARRRKGKKWSSLEEDTLRAGVEQYGVGRWKLILTSNRDIFGERTQVDLKDKWRNLTRQHTHH